MFATIALSLLTLVGCGAAAASHDAKPTCPAGEIIVSVDEPTPCDLVGGQNTLTITDVSPEWAADHGCTFDGDDAGVGCDF